MPSPNSFHESCLTKTLRTYSTLMILPCTLIENAYSIGCKSLSIFAK